MVLRKIDMLTALEMGFIAFIGLFVVVPVVAILSERGRRQPIPQRDLESSDKQRISELEATIKQQQAQIQELKDLLTINILKKDDEESFQQRLRSNE
jgi:vacuolar-type H+-ATPase subunit I/STV1